MRAGVCVLMRGSMGKMSKHCHSRRRARGPWTADNACAPEAGTLQYHDGTTKKSICTAHPSQRKVQASGGHDLCQYALTIYQMQAHAAYQQTGNKCCTLCTDCAGTSHHASQPAQLCNKCTYAEHVSTKSNALALTHTTNRQTHNATYRHLSCEPELWNFLIFGLNFVEFVNRY
jgi:hypothetical protein